MPTTYNSDFAKALTTNSTDATFPSKVPTATEPTGTGVLTPSWVSGQAFDNVLLLPYGSGADNTTFDMRVLGWRKISTLWIPVPLCQVSCTLSAAVGVAGQTVVATERFADTITLAAGFNANVSVELVSPTGDIVGHILLDVKGFAKLEVTFDMTGATDGNCLYAVM